ncbi:putative uncharacterized protein encoded by LINC00269 [Symphalangus syndactylus]|uniref:putative uncharacterized protein encoded by LINC00269 n=1 Tax=Symphalangus syndactylus TaxID=9590 RepID=UPI003005579A
MEIQGPAGSYRSTSFPQLSSDHSLCFCVDTTEERESHSIARVECSGAVMALCSLQLLGSSYCPISASQVAWTAGWKSVISPGEATLLGHCVPGSFYPDHTGEKQRGGEGKCER